MTDYIIRETISPVKDLAAPAVPTVMDNIFWVGISVVCLILVILLACCIRYFMFERQEKLEGRE